MHETKSEIPLNFSWIIKDEVCASGWPRSQENVTFLTEIGVKHLVTLSIKHLPAVNKICGIQHHIINIEEFEAPSIKQIYDFVNICEDARKNKEPILVHCRMGNGRTGLILACYLVKYYKQSPEMAIMKIRLMRPGSVETYDQERIVKEFDDSLYS